MRVIRELPISAIKMDRWPSQRVLGLVDYLRSGGTVPPIHVQVCGSRYRILDGRHRMMAFKLLGRDKIMARYGIRGEE